MTTFGILLAYMTTAEPPRRIITITILGLLVLVMPFLGFPGALKTLFYVGSGLLISGLAVLEWRHLQIAQSLSISSEAGAELTTVVEKITKTKKRPLKVTVSVKDQNGALSLQP